MDPKDLIKVWDAPDNTKLTPKQISLRLPLLVSAKIAAICEMYPRRTKTEIIGDLLSTALDQFGEALESIKSEYCETLPTGDNNSWENVFDDLGSRGRFWDLTGKHLRELEAEAGITEPLKIPSGYICEPADDRHG